MSDNEFLFGKDRIEKFEEEQKAKDAQFEGDKRESMVAGVHEMYLVKASMDTDDKGVISIKYQHNVDMDCKTFKDLNRVFKFDITDIKTNDDKKKKFEKSQDMFLEYLKKSFGYTLKHCAGFSPAFKQTEQFVGKKLKVAVQIKEDLMEFFVPDPDDPKKKTEELIGYKVIKKANLYYTGLITDDKFSIKEDKKFVALDKKLREKLEDHILEFPSRYNDKGELIIKKSDTESTTKTDSSAAQESTQTSIPVPEQDKPAVNFKGNKNAEELDW
jgi:hypothetical protein